MPLLMLYHQIWCIQKFFWRLMFMLQIWCWKRFFCDYQFSYFSRIFARQLFASLLTVLSSDFHIFHFCLVVLQPLRWRCVDCVIHHKWDVREGKHYMWREQAVMEWSRRVISIVACCHSAKLCAHAARDFLLQQQDTLVFSMQNRKVYCVKTMVVLTVAQACKIELRRRDVLQNKSSDGISLFWRPCIKLK